ncbi:NACHT domain-containing protein [Streptomyces sp. NPDC003327]
MSGAVQADGRYLYERLNEKTFQQLCNALLAHSFPETRCYPVGHSDGGRDATREVDGKLVVYQVKWTSKAQQKPATWLNEAIAGEADNIRRLVREGAEAYYLLTSVTGTAVPKRGSMDKLDEHLAKHVEDFGIPIHIWWRADIDARVDAAPDALKWAYSDMLAGHDLVRYLIHGAEAQAHDHALRKLAMNVIATQWEDDAKVKFKQVELTSHRLEDLFIDVEAVRVAVPNNIVGRTSVLPDSAHLGGAASYLMSTRQPFTLIRGEPGQGKSTLGQYVCQLHRAAYLGEPIPVDAPAADESARDPRLPLRVDLHDYAAWLAGIDPFDAAVQKPRATLRRQGSVEEFLAHVLTAHSGGLLATAVEVGGILERLPVLIVLDGLDEVARAQTRERVVEEIDRFTARLRTAFDAQVIVTTRPNVGSLAEPTPDRFETIALDRLSDSLRTTYLYKWVKARSVPEKEHRNLERIFHQRSAEPHIAQLANNPMQLTILLSLMYKRDNSVPANRTDLYTSYMETFLDREAAKTPAVNEHRTDLEEVTSFLGWRLQADAEKESSNGQLPIRELKRLILNYLYSVEKNVALVDDLFTGVTDRVWALTSKAQGTFEFDVQPLREYFAARYMYEFAGADDRTFDRSEILRHLVRRSYWLNTSRFFAGFARPNELAGLVEALEEERDEGARPRQLRLSAWVLLADGVFSGRSKTQNRAADMFLDDLSVRFIHKALTQQDDLPVPTLDRGAKYLADKLLGLVSKDPASRATPERLDLAAYLLDDADAFDEWWHPHMQRAAGSDYETEWLRIGAAFHSASRLTPQEHTTLALADDTAAAAALNAGLAPTPGSRLEGRMIQAVLNGYASELPCSAATFAASLMRILRPQNFLKMADSTADHNLEVIGHLVQDADSQQRQRGFKRLKDRDPRFADLQTASIFRKGQSRTTSPWSNTARVLTSLLGPSWLAAEITVIGAAATNYITGGDLTPGSQPLGPTLDHGRLLAELRRNRTDASWWSEQHGAYPDPLSRATWLLGLLAVAEEHVVNQHLPLMNTTLNALPEDMRQILLMSSSRLGITIARPLSHDTLLAAASLSPAMALAIAHYACQRDRIRSMAQDITGLSTDTLAAMAPFSTAAWPVHLALMARMLPDNHAFDLTLLKTLKALGPKSEIPATGVRFPPEASAAILSSPFDYPMSAVNAAAMFGGRDVTMYLADVATQASWFPA